MGYGGRVSEAGQSEDLEQSDWLPCRACFRRTEHAILRKVRLEDEGEEQLWQIVQCRGCGSLAFRQGVAWPHERDRDTGEYWWRWTVYPEPEFRAEAVKKTELPESVRRLYAETLIAFNHRARTLAAAGLRGVVEALISKGILLKRDADYLHHHRLVGNEAVHEMEGPPEEEFELALEILEHLLKTVYILPILNEDLRKLRQACGARVR